MHAHLKYLKSISPDLITSFTYLWSKNVWIYAAFIFATRLWLIASSVSGRIFLDSYRSRPSGQISILVRLFPALHLLSRIILAVSELVPFLFGSRPSDKKSDQLHTTFYIATLQLSHYLIRHDRELHFLPQKG